VSGIGHGSHGQGQPSFDDADFGFEALANDPIAWLAQSRLPDQKRSPWYDRGRYPLNGTVRDFYLDPANNLADRDLRDLLRALLPNGVGIVGSDQRIFDSNFAKIVDRVESGEAVEYERRLLRAVFGQGRRKDHPAAPIPDLTWIIDLAFANPAQAFQVARAYLAVHFWILPDQVIDGIFDFMATVRCHFRLNSSDDTDAALLRSLSPRDLEYLVAALWQRMRYETSVTKATRDGGKDVIATRKEPGRSEVVLIECRQWAKRVPVAAVREIHDVMSYERANKGIIVAPGGFARGAGSSTEYADAIKTVELLNGSQLVALMKEHYGPRWPVDIDRYIEDGRRIADAQKENHNKSPEQP
jgi:restriction system protein